MEFPFGNSDSYKKYRLFLCFSWRCRLSAKNKAFSRPGTRACANFRFYFHVDLTSLTSLLVSFPKRDRDEAGGRARESRGFSNSTSFDFPPAVVRFAKITPSDSKGECPPGRRSRSDPGRSQRSGVSEDNRASAGRLR